MDLFFNHDGEPISMAEWIALMHINEYVRVAIDTVGDVTISTVWLGINSNPIGPPLIFETGVFGPGDSVEIFRYPSHAEALAGHRAIVASYAAVAN